MQIEISDSVFKNAKSRDVLSCIEKAMLHKHLVTPEDWAGSGFLAWVNDCAMKLDEPDIFEFLQLQLSVGILVNSRRHIRVVDDKLRNPSQGLFGFFEFQCQLLQSTFIYVENARADRSFLLALSLDPKIVADLKKLEELGALVFENCGGITELAKKIESDSDGRRPLLAQRAIAIFDSDAHGPSEAHVSIDAKKAVRACQRWGIQYHRLGRRAIENYIPHATLVEYSELSEARRENRLKMARAISRLSRDQHAYLHMKDGLSVELSKTPLYSGLAEDMKSNLSHGFGPDLSSCFLKVNGVSQERFRDSGLLQEVEEISKFMLEYL